MAFKIDRIRLREIGLPLVHFFETSFGRTYERRMVLVEVVRQMRSKGQGNLPNLMEQLDLVALATVCDVVPLTGLNRAFVVKGLQVARKLGNPGLSELAKISRIGEPLNPIPYLRRTGKER